MSRLCCAYMSDIAIVCICRLLSIASSHCQIRYNSSIDISLAGMKAVETLLVSSLEVDDYPEELWMRVPYSNNLYCLFVVLILRVLPLLLFSS